MNSEFISKAVEGISMRHIVEAERFFYKKPSIRVKKFLIAAATIVLCAITSVISMAAANIAPAYEALYMIWPETAQRLKPVQMSCEDNGIVLEVISANVDGDTAEIYVSLRDITGQNRIDETTDLFDSYNINRPFDCSATCSNVGFNEETGAAEFLICMTMREQRDIGGSKITFSVSEFLSNKNEFSGKIEGFDIKNIMTNPNLIENTNVRGGSNETIVCLAPGINPVFSPVDGVDISAVGFINGQLHIQVDYGDIIEFDNHGYFYFVDENGEKLYCSRNISFWNDDRTGSFDEYVFDISEDELENYDMYGHFITCNTNIKGDWEITFPIE